jgi:hypothetical protein
MLIPPSSSSSSEKGKPNVKRCIELVTRLLDCSFTQSDTDMLFDDFKAMNKSNLVSDGGGGGVDTHMEFYTDHHPPPATTSILRSGSIKWAPKAS